MKLPFTAEEFFKTLEFYNRSVWPMQAIIYALAVLAVLAALGKRRISNRLVAAILAFLWVWMGMVYHILYFTHINKAAYAFGVAFIMEGILFLYFGFVKRRLSFRFVPRYYGITGSIFIIFALFIYPVWGYFTGHLYPASPTFGLPCPTTIFTLGLLLYTDRKLPFILLIIPILWALIGFSAALILGVKEDFSLLVAAIVFIIMLIARKRLLNGTTVPSASPDVS